MARRRARKRDQGAGAVRQLPSGRWQARYRDGDGTLRPAPQTFDTRLDAEAWLDSQDVEKVEAARRDPTLRDYADGWLKGRDLKPRSRAEYRRMLDLLILPALGHLRLSQITPAKVRTWHGTLDAGKATQRANTYTLLHGIMKGAYSDDLIDANPCRIEGGSVVRRKGETRLPSLADLEVMVAKMPDRLRLMVLLAAWLGLRFGELTELRRRDVELHTVHVERGVARVGGEFIVGDPKSAAGRRPVGIPSHLADAVAHHLAEHVGPAPDALLFPSVTDPARHLAPSTWCDSWYPAREAAGRPDLRLHDLRHLGGTLAAATGAPLRDLMRHLGHSTAGAALRYQHAAEDGEARIVAGLSALAGPAR